MKFHHLILAVVLAANQAKARLLALRQGNLGWGAGFDNDGESATCLTLAADASDMAEAQRKFAYYEDYSRMTGNRYSQMINEHSNQINGFWIENHNINF